MSLRSLLVSPARCALWPSWDAFLPRDHVASVNTSFAAAPEKVFDLAVVLQNESDLKTRVTVEDRPLRRVTEIVEERGAAFGGTWTLEFRPTGDETELTITERGHVYNPLFRFLARFMFGHHATMNTFLKTLHTRVEG